MCAGFKIHCLLLVASLAYDSLVNDCFAGEAEWKRSLKTEAPKIWAAYEQTFVGKIRYRKTGSTFDLLRPAKKEHPYLQIDLQCGAAGVKEYYQQLANKGSGYGYVINDRYAFAVNREGPDQDWVVTGIKVKTGEQDYLLPQMKGTPLFTEKRCLRVGPFEASGVWLPEMFEKYQIDITKISMVEIDAKNLPRFVFVGRPKDGKKVRGTYPASGWFVLNPEQFWRVHESEIRRVSVMPGNDVVVHSTVECTTKDGLPLLTKVILTAKGTENNAPIHVRTTLEYSIDRIEPDPAEFRLTAFKLPEPHGVVWPKPTPWYIWLSIAAVAAAAAALLFRTLKRRYQRTAPVGS